MSPTEPLTFVIPMDPHPQGRPRASLRRISQHVQVRDPERSREWKRAVSLWLQNQLTQRGVKRPAHPQGVLLAVHVCSWVARRARPLPQETIWRVGGGDVDNLAKSVLDAGNGVLWHDDAQVAWLLSERRVTQAGASPRVALEVHRLDDRWTEAFWPPGRTL